MTDASFRKNSFTFLRLCFALLVVFSHCFPLGGFGPDPLQRISPKAFPLGVISVLCFFIISGFLISHSAMKQPIWRYFLNRAARIVPGYWINLLFTALILAPVLLTIQFPGELSYWESINLKPFSALGYIGNNLLFHIHQARIFPLFSDLPYEPAVNGSLWSIGPEVMCYLYLGGLALCGALRSRIIVVALFVMMYGLYSLAQFAPNTVHSIAHVTWSGRVFLDHPIYRATFLAFASGMLFYHFRCWLRWDWRWFLAAVASYAGSLAFHRPEFVWPLVLPYLVLFLAYKLPFQAMEKWHDLSFGVYIYSFTIQQCLALAGVHRLGFVPFSIASMALSVVAGYISWRCVEQPVLSWARSIGRCGESAAIGASVPTPPIGEEEELALGICAYPSAKSVA